MRFIYALILGLLFCPFVFSQRVAPTSKPLKLIGDETPLVQVKAEPRKFVGKPFVMTGAIEVSDYYNMAYSEAANSHYSFDFQEAIAPRKLGEDCSIYLKRSIGEKIVERIILKTKDGDRARIRVKVVMDPPRFRDDGDDWQMLELLDVQFSAAGGEEWGPWVIEASRKEAAEAAELEKQRAAMAEIERKKAAEKEKEKERAARTRKWTDRTGTFSLVAEYAGIANGKVTLRKKNGDAVRVPVDRLSEADRKWIDERSKQKRK